MARISQSLEASGDEAVFRWRIFHSKTPQIRAIYPTDGAALQESSRDTSRYISRRTLGVLTQLGAFNWSPII